MEGQQKAIWQKRLRTIDTHIQFAEQFANKTTQSVKCATNITMPALSRQCFENIVELGGREGKLLLKRTYQKSLDEKLAKLDDGSFLGYLKKVCKHFEMSNKNSYIKK